MPVAEETKGGTPKLINRGLKTVPPPNPKQPHNIPPKNDTIRSLNRGFPLNLKSLVTNPLLYFSLRATSFLAIRKDIKVIKGQKIMNAATINQS